MSTTVNPRRRPQRVTGASAAPSLIDSFQNMSIRKGDTFHPNSNTATTDFWDPIAERAAAASPSMPGRADTSPKSLEDLLIGSGERRVAQLFNRVDKAVAARSKAALSNILCDPEVLPVPTLTVNHAAVPDEINKARTRHHSHSSDSGIGSSIADSTETDSSAQHSDRTVTRTARSSVSSQSFSSISDADEERGLSEYATKQIHKHIVEPILKEEQLKEFHDLIKDVPRRIGNKQIKTLRDLEKSLIFLAPEHSRSPSKYLQFCERTIRVLHTTVTTLHESDQRAPADRPYTQGYFFDLVEQIRKYATILAASRAKQAQGEKMNAMDVQGDERVSVHGGMSHNGKPAELVRHTADGKVISIATGQPLSEEELASSSMKRAADLDDDDEDALRSMARRKKNAKPEIHGCTICDKEFKRPCDLTKHIKTHERPWKCSEPDCKYYEHGWPTEKERDRHVNDKHSSTPALYRCLYKPCPYTSKRESNCKQHMEKAHGWNYVRSKSNGKGRATGATRLNQGSIPPSPSSTLLTPLTPIAPSPSVQSWSESSRQGSMAPPAVAGPSNYNTPFLAPSPDFTSHFNMNFDFNDMQNFPTSAFPITPAMSEERCGSGSLSSLSGPAFDGSSFDAASPEDFKFDNFNFTADDFVMQQQYTPDSMNMAGPSSAAHASPGAQMDQTFTNDAMHIDNNTYGGEFPSGPSQDFTLFSGGQAAAISTGEMFPSLAGADGGSSWGNLDNLGSNFGSHFDMGNTPGLPAGSTNQALEELFPELHNGVH